ncbi:TIGR02265 family protein [Anaeromyxobacter sp. Red801]|uniref:TIGR02265 family protein n=1 Tax=Anaeromyxobacter sp. Red801 TaxID=3411632 RepID=UPI003BA3BCC8
MTTTATATRAIGKVKGTLLVSRMNYLRAQGSESAERVLRRLTVADQALLRGTLDPAAWYPADLLIRVELTIAALLARGDRSAMFLAMGRHTAETNLAPAGAHRAYLREGEPHHLLRSVPVLYAASHTSGSRTYEATGPRAAVIRTHGGDEVTADDCLTAVGWLGRAIELSGGKAVKVAETHCRARGAASCEYRCEWA